MSKGKQPSLLRQVIDAYIERWRAHKAMRILAKQDWSVEFLQSLLLRASRVQNQQLEMVVTGPGGSSFLIRTPDPSSVSGVYRDDSIFNHLDDEVKVRSFIESMRRTA